MLKNKLDIKDAEKLARVERRITKQRLRQIAEFPVQPKQLDFKYLCNIHHFIFQDLYDWAGKVRTVDIAKSNLFCKVEYIETMADEIFTELRDERYLSGHGTKENLAKRLAYYLSEINALHPFREGNGRTQREFIRQLAYANGYFLSYNGITQEQMIAASEKSFLRDYQMMEELILLRLRPVNW